MTDLEAAKAFYLGALEPLGYRIVYEEPATLAYFADAHGLDFGIGRREPVGGAHVAFECADHATVDALLRGRHRGRRDRTTARRGCARSTTRTTTRAYVLDPDGNNIEAVCQPRGENPT